MSGARLQTGLHGRDHTRGGSDPQIDVWMDLVVQSPWSNLGAPYHVAQFTLTSSGLRFRGAVVGGTTQTIAFLPVRFWPLHTERYVISRGDGLAVVLNVSSTDGALTQITPP
jgi:hypothetical protein